MSVSNLACCAIAVSSAFALSACQPSNADLPFGTYRSGGVFSQAGLEGTLNLQDGCLVVGNGPNAIGLLLARPARWDEATQTVTQRSVSATVADAVSLGGSEHVPEPNDNSVHRCNVGHPVWAGYFSDWETSG